MPGTGFPTVDELRRIQRDGEELLRGFEVELKKTLIAEKDPAGVVSSWKTKLDAFLKSCAEKSKPPAPPPAVAVIKSVAEETKKRFDELAKKANRAHDQRPNAEKKLVQSYNEAVSGGLATAPEQAVRAGRDQIAKAIRQLVDGALPATMVPAGQSGQWGQAKQQIASSLTKWVEEQDATEDAFFVAQNTLLDAAQFLQRQLTIHSQIRELKTWTEQKKTLDKPASKQVDAQAGALGKAWNDGQKQGEQAVRRAATIRSDLRLDPRFVLDPSKKFLTEVNAKAGITIETTQIKITLSGHVTITEPLLDSRQISGGQQLDVKKGNWALTEKLALDPKNTTFSTGLNYTKGNFTGGASYENTNGQHAVKASISFRF